MRAAAWVLALLCVAAAAGPARAAAPPPRVAAVEPARNGNLVVAHVRTADLPGEKLLQSMRSGLTSAIDLELALLDERQSVLANRRVTLQLAFDLWDEVYSAQGEGVTRRFRSLAELQDHLRDLGPLPIAPADRLRPGERYQLRVVLLVHAIAPAQKERVEDVIAGQPQTPREGQEASVSLGRLIRMFYKGGERRDGATEAVSAWFRIEELRDAAH